MAAFKVGDLVSGILRHDWLGEVVEVGPDGTDDRGRVAVRWLNPTGVWPNPRWEVDVFLVPASEKNPTPISGGANISEVW
jgi:hypothetical protein